MGILQIATVLGALLLGACTTDDAGGGGGLLDPGKDGTSSLEGATLIIEGPGGAESGELELEAGSRTEGFTATLLDSRGNPLEDVQITFTPTQNVKSPTSAASLTSAPTDEDGVVEFSFQAPDEVLEAETLTVNAEASVDRETVEAGYEILIVPEPPPVLTLTGPDNVAPGVLTEGFTARLTTAAGMAIPETFVTLNASAGTVNAPPDRPSSGGAETDGFGRVRFALTTPSSIVQPTTVTVRGMTNVDGTEIEETLQVIVQPDTFQFTQPTDGTPLVVGSENREPLSFQWTHASETGGQGVSGTVTLSASNGARLVLNDDILNSNQSVQVDTDGFSQGSFSVPVSVFNNDSAFSIITARDQVSSSRIARLNLQFVDTPGSINLDAVPLVVSTSPCSARFSSLTVTVLNPANEPITGVDVTFVLLSAASTSVNERVFPPGGTTDAQGKATSRYEAGPTAGTAQVQVEVEGGGISNPRDITISTPATPCT